MRHHGLENSIEIYRGDYTEESGEAAFRLMWEKSRPTAVFAANDLSALGVLSAARTAGVQIPADMSIAGFDNTMLAQSGFVSLSTVVYSRSEMGAVAGDLLKDRLEHQDKKPQTVILTPSLSVRSTTGAPGQR